MLHVAFVAILVGCRGGEESGVQPDTHRRRGHDARRARNSG
jgi:hypothetical protein